MLDQTAAHCGTFVTSHGCPTLTMTANYMRAGKGSEFVATVHLLTVTSAAAVLGAEPTDERDGRIASVSVVVQLVKDTTRYQR
jgi:acyl-coenzyme A thioesterase PaaI-like protein